VPTDKQLICLELLADGFDQSEVASILEVSQQAVSARINKAIKALRAKTLIHAVAIAIRDGLI